jgi:hypothetical protein
MNQITIDLGTQLELSCGCKTMVGKILALAGLQHLAHQSIICPLHLCEHQFSHDAGFMQLAVVVSEVFKKDSGLPTRNLIEFKIGDETLEAVISHSIPRFATITKL